MLPNQCNALLSGAMPPGAEWWASCIDACSEWVSASPKFRMQFPRECFNFFSQNVGILRFLRC